MKKIGIWLCAALMFTACGKNNDDPQPDASRTVLAFFWANNNLDSDLKGNIRNMVAGLRTMSEAATLVVYWDGSSADGVWPQPSIVEFTTDGRGSINGHSQAEVDRLLQSGSTTECLRLGVVAKQYPDQRSTDPEVMRTVVSDMTRVHRSQQYGLVLASHGSGWLPTLTGTPRSIGQDGATSNTILIPELAEALEAAHPQGFDFILFDACMMGTAEVCYELRYATDYCVASVLDIPAEGFPYDRMLPYLYQTHLTDGLTAACREYVSNYNKRAWGTAAVIDCRRMEDLATATKDVLTTHADRMAAVDATKLVEYGRKRPGNSNFVGVSYDMVQYVEALCGGEVPTAFADAFRQAVVFADYTPETAVSYYRVDGDHYCGLGMYVPHVVDANRYVSTLWDPYFRTSIAWYAAAGWSATESSWQGR